MVCYSPLQAYRAADLNSNGKRPITFSRGGSFSGTPVKLPCGQCVGCRIDRAATWAARCMHEKRMFPSDSSSFVTLTYSPENLPKDGGLQVRDLQLFMKRLRKARGPGIRFYGVGEYGGQFGRPHYHVLLFNAGFDNDRKFYRAGKRPGDHLYISKELDQMWGLGQCSFGEVTYESCNYVAGYVIDKITGDKADDWYAGRQPEFSVMSKGIGRSYYMKYGHEIYARDGVLVNERMIRPPRYYDDKWKMVDPMGLDELKAKRRRVARRYKFHADNTVDRRRVREVVQLKKLALRKGQV